MRILSSSLVKFVVAMVVAGSVIVFFSSRRASFNWFSTVATREFNHPEDANQSWIGPPIGERIELVHLKDERGISLSEVIGDELSILVLIDPDCAAAKAASDQLTMVYDGVRPLGVQHYLVSVTSSVPSKEFFEYARSITSGSSVFLWANKNIVPPQSLYSMVLPSHVLVDRNGVIVRKWPGTSISDAVRHRMASEIIAETIAELGSRK